MKTYTFDDPDALTSAGRGILLAAAYWMYRYKQAQVSVYKKSMELVITSDFATVERNSLSYILFEATIFENGRSAYIPFAVSIIEQLPHNFGRNWECAAMIRQLLTNSFDASRN